MIPTLAEKLQSLLLPGTSTTTPARGRRGIAGPSKARRTRSTQPPAQAPLSRGLGGCPPGCGELDVPCLSRFPARLLPLSQPLVSSSDTSIHSALPAPDSPLARRPHPWHTGSLLPLGTPCPWGLPGHLSELTLLCTHRRLSLIETRALWTPLHWLNKQLASGASVG